jgi:hypothetical protein
MEQVPYVWDFGLTNVRIIMEQRPVHLIIHEGTS